MTDKPDEGSLSDKTKRIKVWQNRHDWVPGEDMVVRTRSFPDGWGDNCRVIEHPHNIDSDEAAYILIELQQKRIEQLEQRLDEINKRSESLIFEPEAHRSITDKERWEW